MALSWKGTVMAMIAGGAIGVFLAPIVRPAIARNARPALKAALQTGLLVYRQGREALAEFGEVVEDVTAELQAEQNGAGFEAERAREKAPAPLTGGGRA
jgi:Protein of unknown function (DUF5132)